MRENRRLREKLEGRLDLSIESPVFEGGLGGRTAVSQYANANLGRFMEHMNEAGVRSLEFGAQHARFFLGSVVLRDYLCLLGAPPLTEEEAELRGICRRDLSTESGLARLADPANEKARQRFIRLALRSCAASTTQELVRRSGEMPMARSAGPGVEDDGE